MDASQARDTAAVEAHQTEALEAHQPDAFDAHEVEALDARETEAVQAYAVEAVEPSSPHHGEAAHLPPRSFDMKGLEPADVLQVDDETHRALIAAGC